MNRLLLNSLPFLMWNAQLAVGQEQILTFAPGSSEISLSGGIARATRAHDQGWGVDLDFSHGITHGLSLSAAISLVPEFGSQFETGEYRIVGISGGIQKEFQGATPFSKFKVVPYVTGTLGPQTMTIARSTEIGVVNESYRQAWWAAGGGVRLLRSITEHDASVRLQYTISRGFIGAFDSGYVHRLSIGLCLRFAH